MIYAVCQLKNKRKNGIILLHIMGQNERGSRMDREYTNTYTEEEKELIDVIRASHIPNVLQKTTNLVENLVKQNESQISVVQQAIF